MNLKLNLVLPASTGLDIPIKPLHNKENLSAIYVPQY
jgi:hypothetical protein